MDVLQVDEQKAPSVTHSSNELGGTAVGVPARRLHALQDLDLPALLLHDQAVRANVRIMADYCSVNGVYLAPHAKTSMTAYIAGLQAEAGAWGQTAATIVHASRLWEMGHRHILLANVLVELRGIDWVAGHVLTLPEAEADLVCYVDCLRGVEILEDALSRLGPNRRLGVLVEVGYAGGRTGVRSVDEAVRLAERVRSSRFLELRGVAAFEGLMPRGHEAVPSGIDGFLQSVRDVVTRCAAKHLFERAPIITAGGSSYFDLVVDKLGPESFDFETVTVLRSGCYATHDHGVYHETSPFDGRAASAEAPRFTAALELLATVWSRPEPELVIAGFGRRDVPTDDRLPVVHGVFAPEGSVTPSEAEVVGVNDQHAFLKVPAHSELVPGNVLSLGISHPCGAFDRWRSIPVVDVDRWIIGAATPRL